jgi:bifunctional DNA-binding transcriptional regulator/antitoxin component of YhaV-PrlF toxin-antitoxin module
MHFLQEDNMSEAAIITSKGQVTLPRAIRNLLGGRVVVFESTDAGILIKPVNSVAGSLNSYAHAAPESISVARDAAWKEVADEKGRKRST